MRRAACMLPRLEQSPAGAAGSAAAQRTAAHFVALRASVYAYALTVVFRAEAAEDLTQETFLRLYTHLAEGNEVENPKAWVLRVCHNLAINHARRFPRDRTSLDRSPGYGLEDVWSTLPDAEPNPELLLLRKERDQRLEDAIRRLTDRQRRCLYLRAEGLRYREIGCQLGISISTVVDALTRAVQRLRDSEHGGI